MIYCLIALLAFSTAVNGQDCGGDNTLGCMDDTECATFGAGITCDRAAPTDVLGCCNVPTTTTAAVTTTVAAACVDLTNPSTGVSDCPSMRGYCNNTIYNALMQIQYYVPDQCMTNALLQPQYLVDNAFKICPTYAVEGEAVARLYIISVIFPNGTYRAFANDQTMRWDQQKALYTIRYVNGGVTFFDEPIYAATCAFIKDDLRPYPLDACAGNYITRLLATKNNKLLTYSATTSMILHCRAGLWIQAAVPTATNYNSWEVSAGACYR
ncbi:hypothetical protein PRIPAC_78990 [Pristionchus pacificus]|uniref:Uncharacterized protein n=1 Tax=Pristionchus pacificus TaxID=54126 RepID=A0A2A6CNL5_PRIPA|nr:hypothetical protein PRIPAC_78990 [Pristionchus pacificus]|eukprot:PDM79792.1 hypothetical protein PRIPAC_32371 [Pristionchus pacificus]